MKFTVIPDIHGRFDALSAMLLHCGAVKKQGNTLAWAGGGQAVVQLGDLVDRGPQVRECLDLLFELQSQAREKLVILKGNHEDMLLSSVREGRPSDLWMENGARATLESYGKDFGAWFNPGGAMVRWLSGLPVSFEQSGVLFTHGGLSAANQKLLLPEKLMWDRPPFVLGAYQALVCGHTPTPSGRVEVKGDIFFCDIGLGWNREADLEYLTLELGGKGIIRWKVARV